MGPRDGWASHLNPDVLTIHPTFHGNELAPEKFGAVLVILSLQPNRTYMTKYALLVIQYLSR